MDNFKNRSVLLMPLGASCPGRWALQPTTVTTNHFTNLKMAQLFCLKFKVYKMVSILAARIWNVFHFQIENLRKMIKLKDGACFKSGIRTLLISSPFLKTLCCSAGVGVVLEIIYVDLDQELGIRCVLVAGCWTKVMFFLFLTLHVVCPWWSLRLNCNDKVLWIWNFT